MKKSIFFLMIWIMILIIASGCADERYKVTRAPETPETPETPVTGTLTTLHITTNPVHNGLMWGWLVEGIGVWNRTTSFGTSTKEPETESITIPSRMELSATLHFDTIDVEEFGAEPITLPDFTETEISTDTLVGKKISMSTIRLSDGQLVDGFLLWGYTPNPLHPEVHPHVEGRNPFFGEIEVIPIPGTSPALAWVTSTFTGEVIGKDADKVTGDTGEKEITLSYIQRKKEQEPEPEEKPEPETKIEIKLDFTMKSENLKANLWCRYTGETTQEWEKSWTAAKIGHYDGLACYYADNAQYVTAERDTVTSTNGDPIVTEKDGAVWTRSPFSQRITDNVYILTTAGSKNYGPQQTVFFDTSDMELVLSTGEKIQVHLHPTTIFEDITYKVVPELVGKTTIESGEEYTYTKTLVQTARHYLTCTLVFPDGHEETRNIDCLVDGLFRTNCAESNIYIK